MNIRPLHDRVVLKRSKEETKSSGGIILTDSAKEKPMQGKILSIGKGKSLKDGSYKKLDVKVGDNVLFGKYAGTEIKHEGEKLLIMKEEDIIAIVE